MARARTIKPGFCQNEALAELPFETRLCFALLPMFADREGRLEDRPKRLKMQMFPADSVDVDDLLEQLHDAGFIHRYQVGEGRYIQIVNFRKHQKPHQNEAASEIPESPAKVESACDQGSKPCEPREVALALDLDLDLDLDEKPTEIPLQKASRKRAAALEARKGFFDFAKDHDAVDEAADYEAVLKRKKAATTERAWRDRLKTLIDLHARGSPVKAVLAKSADSGWTGLFEVRDGNGTAQHGTRESAVQRSERLEREYLAARGVPP